MSLPDLRMTGLRMELIQGKVGLKKVLNDNVWTPRSTGALCSRSLDFSIYFANLLLLNYFELGFIILLCIIQVTALRHQRKFD